MPTSSPTPTGSSDPGIARSPRLAPAALLAHASRLVGPGRRSALLVVALHRSDRLAALAQAAHARVVLGEAARRIEAILRPSDRYSISAHDEIWLLLADLPSGSIAELAARTLRTSLSHPIPVTLDGGRETIVQMRPVIGAAWCQGASPGDAMSLLGCAADACARAATLDEHVLAVQFDLQHETVSRARIEAQLRSALHNNELDVFFQPQVDVAAGRCVGAEALVRWTREDGSQVNPALIASVCEERGLMGQLTQFVLNTSLRHLMTWSSQGVEPRVSINLSSVTLADASYPALVAQALATWGIEPHRLTLELTENVIVRNETAARRFMAEVRGQGCRLALDDFGTGYSSFAYLRQFPIDELKIDQSFVRNLATDRSDRRIVRAVVDLAHAFEMKALAEGVEDAESFGLLREVGCDLVQGYHFSRALAPFDFVDWYRRFNDTVEREEHAAVP